MGSCTSATSNPSIFAREDMIPTKILSPTAPKGAPKVQNDLLGAAGGQRWQRLDEDATRRARPGCDRASSHPSRKFSSGRRGPGPGHQGRNRYQGSDAFHVHQHSRALSGADACAGRIGVSRKIEDEDARRRLRDILRELNPPKGWASSFARPAPTAPRKSCPATWPICCGSGK